MTDGMTLPVELLNEIAQLLSLADRRTFSLASRLARSVTAPFIFGFVSYCGDLTRKVGCINQAGSEAKAMIINLSLSESGEVVGDESIIFQFLESLPNLKTFSYIRWKWGKVNRPSLRGLITSLRHCPLRDFELHFSPEGYDEDHPTPGPSGLQKLILYAPERMEPFGIHMFKLIQPSFTSLVELVIHHSPNRKALGPVPFDLRQLRPVGATLRSFSYYPAVLDTSILDTIPETFPLLSNLHITLSRKDDKSGDHWKNILSLAKNINLQHLNISTDRVTDCGFNHRSGGDCPQCSEYLLRATRTLALSCRKLERCCWIAVFETHVFDIIYDLESNERVVQSVTSASLVSPITKTTMIKS